MEQVFPSVEEQLQDELSLLSYYKRALNMRNKNPELARGTITKEEKLCDGTVAAIKKTWTREDESGNSVTSEVIVIYNTTDEAAVIDLSSDEYKELKISGYLTLDNTQITIKDGHVEMPGQSICVLK